MDNEARHIIRERWINSLFELAHPEFQIRLWTQADYENSIGDFSECVCKYFDDLNLDEGYSYFISNEVITETEYEFVNELHHKFNKYVNISNEEDLSDIEVISDPRWTEITNMALVCWRNIKTKTASASEKERMIEQEKLYLNKA